MGDQWLDYYKKVSGRPVDPILKIAMNFVEKKDFAYDLGCGAGDDIPFLLQQGFTVTAVDKEQSAFEFIRSKKITSKKIILENSSFEELVMRSSNILLGRFSFPFCHPDYFDQFWEKMKRSLSSGGILCGTLFGIKDDWSKNTHMTFTKESDWKKLLADYEIMYFDEIEMDSPTSVGFVKHWHQYHFILKKREA